MVSQGIPTDSPLTMNINQSYLVYFASLLDVDRCFCDIIELATTVYSSSLTINLVYIPLFCRRFPVVGYPEGMSLVQQFTELPTTAYSSSLTINLNLVYRPLFCRRFPVVGCAEVTIEAAPQSHSVTNRQGTAPAKAAEYALYIMQFASTYA
ncbi:uncharacterized protein EDB93DRAFT_1327231 [Suillus bovinus]|uniref:uncharacterized protein n=1 Tax=Suillus bovinus TaxID=48563 RepID=UPI001B8708FE|nr:uncharacterized protein EDB93DRAFT_1327231 [Suillus bovinus]KAG2153725.1 hypothetical protein EDB93DRAFT_1327231 [Suillus bovinus]